MSRYLLKRMWGEVSDPEMADNARRIVVADEGFDDITWEHSHVVIDDVGRCISYCVYEAPDAERLLAHARATGGHFVDEVFEIAGDVSPADFAPWRGSARPRRRPTVAVDGSTLRGNPSPLPTAQRSR